MPNLKRKNLDPDPFQQFNLWFSEAKAADPRFPNAMGLATADKDGQPSVRMVLLLPSFRGGFRLIPKEYEFWQDQPDRLHDRFRYGRSSNGDWQLVRLSP